MFTKGLWEHTSLYCGFHDNFDESTLMQLTEKRGQLVYCCPQCNNSISSNLVENLLGKISKNSFNNIKSFDFGSLEGNKYIVGKDRIKCEIIKEKENNGYDIKIYNIKARMEKK